eukprot:TRINITY_DN15874_c0_g1_i2.p1 TRINITY_DN15874_c0_g1~~TRINITY_DN15874_c0_g1_i2.p1  ORF type:complete len:1006 (+),score=249.26 TRINITY_DN15874_c0_g1_i2:75-3020(+)
MDAPVRLAALLGVPPARPLRELFAAASAFLLADARAASAAADAERGARRAQARDAVRRALRDDDLLHAVAAEVADSPEARAHSVSPWLAERRRAEDSDDAEDEDGPDAGAGSAAAGLLAACTRCQLIADPQQRNGALHALFGPRHLRNEEWGSRQHGGVPGFAEDALGGGGGAAGAELRLAVARELAEHLGVQPPRCAIPLLCHPNVWHPGLLQVARTAAAAASEPAELEGHLLRVLCALAATELPGGRPDGAGAELLCAALQPIAARGPPHWSVLRAVYEQLRNRTAGPDLGQLCGCAEQLCSMRPRQAVAVLCQTPPAEWPAALRRGPSAAAAPGGAAPPPVTFSAQQSEPDLGVTNPSNPSFVPSQGLVFSCASPPSSFAPDPSAPGAMETPAPPVRTAPSESSAPDVSALTPPDQHAGAAGGLRAPSASRASSATVSSPSAAGASAPPLGRGAAPPQRRKSPVPPPKRPGHVPPPHQAGGSPRPARSKSASPPPAGSPLRGLTKSPTPPPPGSPLRGLTKSPTPPAPSPTRAKAASPPAPAPAKLAGHAALPPAATERAASGSPPIIGSPKRPRQRAGEGPAPPPLGSPKHARRRGRQGAAAPLGGSPKRQSRPAPEAPRPWEWRDPTASPRGSHVTPRTEATTARVPVAVMGAVSCCGTESENRSLQRSPAESSDGGFCVGSPLRADALSPLAVGSPLTTPPGSPRRPPAVGARVRRNPGSWCWGQQDGGAGCQGEVAGPPEEGWLPIRWDASGCTNYYRWGCDGEYDVVPDTTAEEEGVDVHVARGELGIYLEVTSLDEPAVRLHRAPPREHRPYGHCAPRRAISPPRGPPNCSSSARRTQSARGAPAAVQRTLVWDLTPPRVSRGGHSGPCSPLELSPGAAAAAAARAAWHPHPPADTGAPPVPPLQTPPAGASLLHQSHCSARQASAVSSPRWAVPSRGSGLWAAPLRAAAPAGRPRITVWELVTPQASHRRP